MALEAGGGSGPPGGHVHAGVPHLRQRSGGDRGDSQHRRHREPGGKRPLRAPATLFGHEKVYFVIGRNKLAPTYDEALWRARNIAAPKNAQRLGKKTPCAVKGDRCYDCKSPDRICRGLVTLWGPMTGMEAEVLLVDEDLGL